MIAVRRELVDEVANVLVDAVHGRGQHDGRHLAVGCGRREVAVELAAIALERILMVLPCILLLPIAFAVGGQRSRTPNDLCLPSHWIVDHLSIGFVLPKCRSLVGSFSENWVRSANVDQAPDLLALSALLARWGGRGRVHIRGGMAPAAPIRGFASAPGSATEMFGTLMRSLGTRRAYNNVYNE